MVKALEKQTKTNGDQGRKQFETLKVSKPDVQQQLTVKDAIPECHLNEESKNEIDRVKEIEKMVNREDLSYETRKCVNNFQLFQSIRSFVKKFFAGKIDLNNADRDQNDLLFGIVDFNSKSRYL